MLHDLRIPPSATDPRPLFVPSAEAPRDAKPYVHQSYPKLLWHTVTGKEITVQSAEQHVALGGEWGSTPPTIVQVDAAAQVKDELAGLSDEDRDFVLESQRKAKLDRLMAKMATLSEADQDAMIDTNAMQHNITRVAAIAQSPELTAPAKIDKRTKAYKQSQG